MEQDGGKKSTEMFILDPGPGESPDLGAWLDLLSPEDAKEIREILRLRALEGEQ